MARRLPRHVLPNRLHELTFRCHQSRSLLKPGTKLNRLLIGCLAKAQQLTGVEIIWFVALSNHAHALVRPSSHTQLAEFLCHLKTNLSKEAGRLYDYPGGIFTGVRTDVAPVTDEPEAQIARLLYLLSQGVKESLCPSPQSWPGVHCCNAILNGKLELQGGLWVNRTALFNDRRRHRRNIERKIAVNEPITDLQEPQESDYATEMTVQLSKLLLNQVQDRLCWEHMTDEQYCSDVRDLMQSVVEKYKEQIEGLPQDWRRRILRRVATVRPEKTKRGTRVLVHAASRKERTAFRDAISRWVSTYWDASEKFRAGCLDAIKHFPPNCFPPTLPGSIVAQN